ncbi:MAG TPA: cytochrome P450 [Actinomycetota bacterium]
MAAAPVADDVTVAELEDDPYPVYARLRREAPVCWVPAVGLWFLTRWADVVAAAEDQVRFPASMPGSPLDRTLGGRSVLTVDGEEHERMRAPMEATLRPKLLEAHAPATVERVANELLDALAPRGEAELMSAFCEPFAVLTLAEVIGLPPLGADTLMRWFHDIATGTSNYEADPAKQALADRTAAEVDATLRPRFAELLERPDGSMISDMLHAETGDLDERLAALLPSLKLALIGGLQEPGHGLGTTVVGLLADPAQRDAFAADPTGLARKATEEAIRWISPIGTQGRAAGPGVAIAGVEIPEGEPVGIMIPSANRDEEVFGPTADRFDLARARHAHAAFGFGGHFCVGHHLARIQMRTGIRLLFERLPNLRLDGSPRFRGWEYRGPASLPVRWDA